MRIFTPEDLLEYHYNEMTEEQRTALQAEMEQNWTLREKLSVIKEAARRLDKSFEQPRRQAVGNILQYAARHQKASVN